MSEPMKATKHICSFCGKDSSQVSVMIAAPLAMICCECVLLSMQIIIDKGKEVAFPKPKDTTP